MSSLTTILGTDIISDSRTVINTNFQTLNTDKEEVSNKSTDTAMTANSDTLYPSQKATKAYADSVAGANASTTAKGNVEIATAAQIDAGTGTGETGAVIVLSPDNVNSAHNIPFVAPGTSGNIMTSNGTDWTSATPVPFFQQDLSLFANDSLSSAEFTAGSMTDGSAFFVKVQGGTDSIYRFQRDTLTGQYIITHAVATTILVPAGDGGAIINIGSYIYLFSNDGTNIICSRFLAADLTGEQVMTVPTVTCTAKVQAWTDGTNAYVVTNTSDTTSRTWSVSGTTFSAVTTTSISPGSTYAELNMSSMWDGTNAWLIRGNHGNQVFNIYKLNTITGSSITASTKKSTNFYSDVTIGGFIINIDSTKMYIGFMYAIYDEAAVVSPRISLIPVSKP